MIVYSKKIVRFICEIKAVAKAILTEEVCLKVVGDRFYNKQQTTSYPLKIVVYNNKAKLGYFDSSFYELGFSECLMHVSKKQLHDIIRHELAHYMAFIKYGEGIQIHGVEFQTICKQMGWGESVFRATVRLESDSSEVFESHVLRKVKKLMALATSSNPHEAELAVIKSREILLKNNIESNYIKEEDGSKIFLKRIMKQKKENAKMRSIATILETFFVSTVYNRAGDYIYLEIVGNEINIEIAEYVAGVLDHEFDKLWVQAQLSTNLKGLNAKNSFFLGIAKGYCNKINALKREYSSETTHAVMVIEKALVDAKNMVYKRLSSVKRSNVYCKESSELGEQMGRKLSINPAISKSHSSILVLQ